jgi:hypothetical protein
LLWVAPMRLPFLVSLGLVAGLGLVTADARALEPPAVGGVLALSLDAHRYAPSAFESYRPFSLSSPPPLGSAGASASASDRDVTRLAVHGSHHAHSLGWVGTVMGVSGMAIGTTFLGLSTEGSGSASVATRTMAHTDRTVGVAGLLGGVAMLGVGVITLVLSGTDVRAALGETLARLPASGKPALRLSF